MSASANNSTDCPICMEEIGEFNKVVTECGHTFHCSCFVQNIFVTDCFMCPYCRNDLIEDANDDIDVDTEIDNDDDADFANDFDNDDNNDNNNDFDNDDNNDNNNDFDNENDNDSNNSS